MSRPSRSSKRGKGDAVPESREERRETCKQAEEKIQVGMVPTHVQLHDFAPPKGAERPAALTPQRDSPNWRRAEELRRAAGPLLVAGNPVRDLLLRAKHLFVATTVPPFVRSGSPRSQSRSVQSLTGSQRRARMKLRTAK
jgi:hypothetical protein